MHRDHKTFKKNPLQFGKSIEDAMMDGFVVDWNTELRDSEDFQMAIESTNFMADHANIAY